MPLPTNERLRNLEQIVDQQQQITYDGHPAEDQILHGILWKIESYDSSCQTSGACLVLCPVPPLDVKQNGALVFENNKTHPLANYSDDIQQIRVWVLNVDPAWLQVYYSKGDLIKYWRYTGTAEVIGSSGGGGETSEEIIGSEEGSGGSTSRGDPSYVDGISGAFVTLKEDLSFWGEVEYIGDDSTSKLHRYKVTAKNADFSGHANERWQTPHTCATENLLEVSAFNVADANGTIGPTVGKQVTRVWPVLISDDVTADPQFEYWFDITPGVFPVLLTSAAQDGSNYRWTYTGNLAAKTGKKWAGWVAIPGQDAVTCFNGIECPNHDSPAGYGNGIQASNLSGSGYNLVPIADGVVVFCTRCDVPGSSGGGGSSSDTEEEFIGSGSESEEMGSEASGSTGPVIEYWFHAVNAIDGACESGM